MGEELKRLIGRWPRIIQCLQTIPIENHCVSQKDVIHFKDILMFYDRDHNISEVIEGLYQTCLQIN